MKQIACSPASFWSLLALFALSGAAQGATNRWEGEIAAFEASDRTNPPPKGAFLFIGSSSIRLWKTLAADFPQHQVINRGFGGSQIADSVRFADRIVTPCRPKMIVMYSGGNDINASRSPEQVAADFKAFVRKVRGVLPDTKIAYISIAPNPARWAQVERVRKANEMIRDFTKSDSKLRFIDVFPHMLGQDGKPLEGIFVDDGLHMNERGYALWTKLVRPFLEGE
ncbi:MAG: GDSL-type esterase/lipase family protein [Verrucomicrobia subdivision 3 bacterium]|nr:GDSL-type esterase/lipase family protein [Limisphaerales bacterium]